MRPCLVGLTSDEARRGGGSLSDCAVRGEGEREPGRREGKRGDPERGRVSSDASFHGDAIVEACSS